MIFRKLTTDPPTREGTAIFIMAEDDEDYEFIRAVEEDIKEHISQLSNKRIKSKVPKPGSDKVGKLKTRDLIDET